MYSMRRVGLIFLVLVFSIAFLSGGMALADGEWIFNGPMYDVLVQQIDVSNTFDAVTAKMPEFAELGVSTIWMRPIFYHVNYSSPYSIIDYYMLHPPHGTSTDLTELVTGVHNNQMKVLFDLVVSYTPEKLHPEQHESWIYLNHPEWILHDPQTNEMLRHINNWGWALDHIHTGLITYLTDVAKYYMTSYNIDGWRIDAPQRNYDPAKFPTPRYATDMLRSVKNGMLSLNPNAPMYAEWSGPEVPWNFLADPLFDEMAEVSTDWESRNWILGRATGQVAGGTSAEFVNLINNQVVWYGRGRVRFLESFDVQRLATTLSTYGRVDSNNPLITLISTLPGVPMIQAGQEIRSTATRYEPVNWAAGDTTLRAFYKKVFAVRKAHPVLNSGRGTLSNIWTSGTDAIAYARIASGASAPVGNNGVIVLLNVFYANSPNAITFTVSIPGLDPNTTYQLYELLTDTVLGTATGAQLSSNYTMNLAAYGAQVIKLIPTATYNCDSTTVNTGSIISGSHTNLHANDGSYFQVRAGTSGSYKRTDWNADVTIAQQPSKVTKLEITYDGKYSSNVTQYLRLWNFTTSAWDQIDSRTVGTTDVTITWSTTDPVTIQKYISSAGVIKLDVAAQKTTSFDCYGDYVKYYIEYTP